MREIRRPRLVVVALSSFLVVAATVAGAAPFEGVGIKVGATSSHMHLDGMTYGSSESAAGFVIGPFVDVALSPSLVFQPALVFVRRGGTYHDLPSSLDNTQDEADELAFRRDYLELPLLLRYRGPWRSKLPLTLIAGPSLGWVLAYEVEEDGSDLTRPINEDGLELSRESGGYDLAVVLGAGLTGAPWGRQWTLDVVYRMATDGTSSDAAGSSFKADGIDVTLGLRF